MKYRINIALLAIGLWIGACTNSAVPTEEAATDKMEISKTQFESEKMEMSQPVDIVFADKLHFTGTVVPAPNGSAIVSAPVAGTIKNIFVVNGQSVQKGAALLEISGHDIIDLQRDYAEAAATLQRVQMDYERAKALYDENIGAKKDFTLAENSYKVELAKCNALKMKLEGVGLNVAKIAEGMFYNSYVLKAPIAGYVSQVEAVVGRFVEPLSVLSEIVDASSFRVSIPVFGADINKVSSSLKVEFYADSKQKNILHGSITSVGKSLDPNTKAVMCFAQIEDKSKLVSHQFVEGDIILSSDTSLAVPRSAILSSEKSHFVLVLQSVSQDSYFFKKTEVSIGRENASYSELLGTELEGKEVLVNGIYHIVVE